MSRITVVLFHLVLTASVTVWANNERQLVQDGKESEQGTAVSEQPDVKDAGNLPDSESVTTSGAATKADQSGALTPSI